MKKIIKYIMEIIFIFIIPLLLIIFNINVKKEYDENNNEIEKSLEFNESLIQIYDNNLEYKNILHYNQLLKNNRILDNSNDWLIYNIDHFRFDNGFYVPNVDLNCNRTSQLYQLNINNSKLNDKIYIRYDIESDISYDLRISLGSYYERNDLGNKTDEFIVTLNSNTISEFSLYLNYNGLQTGNVKISNVYLINLSNAFGVGNEPSTIEQVNSYFEFNNDYGYTLDYIINYFSNDIISSYYEINYSWYSRLFNYIFSALNINNNIPLTIIIIYTLLWLIMWFIWHLLYLPLDFIVSKLLFDRVDK